jgi:glutathione S-transferase
VITLYGPAQAPFTEKVRRALLYKGYEFELREPQSPEDYRRWSPKTGMLPVLDLDGEHVPDSTEILYRIDRDRPDPPLLSSDPTVATQQRQLEDWADESFLFYYMKYQRTVAHQAQVVAAAAAAAAAAERGTARSRSGPLRRLRAWLRAGGTWERPETAIVRELGLRLDDLTKFLGARVFFYSDRLSMADLGVYAMLSTMRLDAIPGSAQLVAQRPALIGLMRRVEEVTGG